MDNKQLQQITNLKSIGWTYYNYFLSKLAAYSSEGYEYNQPDDCVEGERGDDGDAGGDGEFGSGFQGYTYNR